MRAHIVGGGFGGLAAAALLIRNGGASVRQRFLFRHLRSRGDSIKAAAGAA
jgi:2-polyprenyl-6-methoxyphenol hydroxylase-like FAD-dependent oxidoreductase